jgi:hypothetical protein
MGRRGRALSDPVDRAVGSFPPIGDFTLTIRNGPKVERDRFDAVGPAIDALQRRMEELAGTTRRRTVDLRYKRFEPVQQVAVRAEISGPGRLRAGVDLRGDGSTEAYTGRLRRRLVEQRERETPYDALRRSLGGS